MGRRWSWGGLDLDWWGNGDVGVRLRILGKEVLLSIVLPCLAGPSVG